MKTDAPPSKVREADKVDLGRWATKVKPLCKSKKAVRQLLQDHVEQLSDRQCLLYASNSHALLVIFQAMDTAGKDGAIRHVMSGVNPQGCQVFSFQHPSAQVQAGPSWPHRCLTLAPGCPDAISLPASRRDDQQRPGRGQCCRARCCSASCFDGTVSGAQPA